MRFAHDAQTRFSRNEKATRAPATVVQYPDSALTPISVPVLALQRLRAVECRMRSDSVPVRPATGSEAAIATPPGRRDIASSSRTTARGLTRSARERPDPSYTWARAPRPPSAERTTAAPAKVVPALPDHEPMSLSSNSAAKLSEGTLICAMTVLSGGEA